MFIRYQHLEKFGSDEVTDIDLGQCYIFPKLDGTNASVWVEDGVICAGSRNRQLSLDNDNAGFLAAMVDDCRVRTYFEKYPNMRLYGEWLVPHSLKSYRFNAWRQFYVFDVLDEETSSFLSFADYSSWVEGYNIEVIPPIAIIGNPSYDQLLKCMEKTTYLIEDGKGVGEGIVIKNYAFENRFGRKTWAKMVTNEFKEKHVKAMGPSILAGKKMIEEDIMDEYITEHLINKTYEKIKLDNDGFNSRNIPELLNRVFHDLVKEEIWDIVKNNNNPTINFKTLKSLTIRKIKGLRPELF